MTEIRRDRWGRYFVVPPQGGKPVGYTRATTVAKTLDDGGGLMPWKATATMVGSMRRPGLAARWAALFAENPDPWYASEDSKKACKKLVEECSEAGGSTDRADIGTALHALVELINSGNTPIIQGPMQADVAAYSATVATAGLELDAALIEAMVVLDGYQVAGTADILCCTVPGIGRVVADLKTGTDLKYSWQAIAIQLAIYANSDAVYVQGEAADGSGDKRLAMPELSKAQGLVIHLPAGEARCELHLVDIAAGWEAFESSMATRKWRSRRDLATPFKIATPTAPTAVGASGSAPSVPRSPVSGTIEPPPFDDAATSAAAGAGVREDPGAPGGVVTPAAAIPDFDDAVGIAAPPPPAPVPASVTPVEETPRALDWVDRPRELPTTPDEGADLTGDERWADLEARFRALEPDVREWTSRVAKEANAAGVQFSTAQKHWTGRRLNIYRGLLDFTDTILLDGDDNGEAEEAMRALLALAFESEAPLFPTITVGKALGSLDATTAARFVEVVHTYLAGQLVGSINDAEQFVLAEAVSA